MAAPPMLAEMFAAPVVGEGGGPVVWRERSVLADDVPMHDSTPVPVPHQTEFDLSVFHSYMQDMQDAYLCMRCGQRFRERDNVGERKCYLHPLPPASHKGEAGVGRADFMCCGASELFGAPNFDARLPQGCTRAHHVASGATLGVVFDVAPKQLYQAGLLGEVVPEGAFLIETWEEHAQRMILLRRPRIGAAEVTRYHGESATATVAPCNLPEFQARLGDAFAAVAPNDDGDDLVDLFSVYDTRGVQAALDRAARADARAADPFIPYYIFSRISPEHDSRRIKSVRQLPRRK